MLTIIFFFWGGEKMKTIEDKRMVKVEFIFLLKLPFLDPSVSKSNRLHVDISRVSFIKLDVCSPKPLKMIGNFHES
jgi:hypothetical protein